VGADVVLTGEPHTLHTVELLNCSQEGGQIKRWSLRNIQKDSQSYKALKGFVMFLLLLTKLKNEIMNLGGKKILKEVQKNFPKHFSRH
jgi:hypothetical protein